jgi:hypothetical protein
MGGAQLHSGSRVRRFRSGLDQPGGRGAGADRGPANRSAAGPSDRKINVRSKKWCKAR